MVRKFGPFDTSQFYEVENRRMQRAFNPRTGFVKTGQGAVTAGTGAQLVIAAYPDGALIDGLYVENPTTETVTLTTNSGNTNPRIDRLVMRLDMTAKTIAPAQIVGTPAASPAAPPLVNTATVVDMPLCRYTMPGSASAQNPGSIIDERQWITPVTKSLGYNANYQSIAAGGEFATAALVCDGVHRELQGSFTNAVPISSSAAQVAYPFAQLDAADRPANTRKFVTDAYVGTSEVMAVVFVRQSGSLDYLLPTVAPATGLTVSLNGINWRAGA